MIEEHGFDYSLHGVDPKVPAAEMGQLVSQHRFQHFGRGLGKPRGRQQHDGADEAQDHAFADPIGNQYARDEAQAQLPCEPCDGREPLRRHEATARHQRAESYQSCRQPRAECDDAEHPTRHHVRRRDRTPAAPRGHPYRLPRRDALGRRRPVEIALGVVRLGPRQRLCDRLGRRGRQNQVGSYRAGGHHHERGKGKQATGLGPGNSQDACQQHSQYRDERPLPEEVGQSQCDPLARGPR